MTQPEIEIRRAWRHATVQQGSQVDGYVDALLIKYREPHRHYHTATHIMWVLRHLHDIAPARPTETAAAPAPAAVTPPSPSAELVVAALYHDAIYDPRSADNEALSAALAAADLAELGWERERCAVVEQLILATAGHVNDDAAAQPLDRANADRVMLLDADLAILGADPGAYQAYVNGVRAEYAHLSDDEWRTGRAGVLQHFLDRPRLFATEFMYISRERRARANIGAELAALGAGGD